MKIIKKVQCLHCEGVIEGEDTKCLCGKVIIAENTIVSGSVAGVDYKDLTPKLLNG